MKKLAQAFKLAFIPSKENNYRPSFLLSNFLTWLIFVLFLLRVIFIFFFINFPEIPLFAKVSRNLLLKFTNEARKKAGIETLAENEKLNEAAYLKAKDILEKNYFDHISPEGISPWHWFLKAGYQYQSAGENLAIGFDDSEELFEELMKSEVHKKNILNSDFKEVGIAVLTGDFKGTQVAVAVQLFGTQRREIFAKKEIQTPKNKESPKKEALITLKEKLTLPPEKSSMVEFQKPLFGAKGIKKASLKESFLIKFLEFFAFSYEKIIKGIFLTILFLIILALFFDIFIYPKIQYKDLILKGVFYVFLLIFLFFFDKDVILRILPSNLKII